MKRTIGILAVVAVLAAVAIYQYANERKELAGPDGAAPAAVSDEEKPKPGYKAPEFTLPNLAEEEVAVGGPSDKLVMINFWASWCGPCELEAPDLQKIHEIYGDRLTLYGVNSTKYDRERDARKFVEQMNLTFPILMDREGTVTKLYKVDQEFPTTVLVNRGGHVVERVTGVIPLDQWKAIIEQHLSAS